MDWKTIDSAPKDEIKSYLVWVPKRKGIDEYDSVIQVSNFQGDMYPDNKQCCIDWGDRIQGATHWAEYKPPQAQEE